LNEARSCRHLAASTFGLCWPSRAQSFAQQIKHEFRGFLLVAHAPGYIGREIKLLHSSEALGRKRIFAVAAKNALRRPMARRPMLHHGNPRLFVCKRFLVCKIASQLSANR
jgi:hypothetical protein